MNERYSSAIVKILPDQRLFALEHYLANDSQIVAESLLQGLDSFEKVLADLEKIDTLNRFSLPLFSAKYLALISNTVAQTALLCEFEVFSRYFQELNAANFKPRTSSPKSNSPKTSRLSFDRPYNLSPLRIFLHSNMHDNIVRAALHQDYRVSDLVLNCLGDYAVDIELVAQKYLSHEMPHDLQNLRHFVRHIEDNYYFSFFDLMKPEWLAFIACEALQFDDEDLLRFVLSGVYQPNSKEQKRLLTNEYVLSAAFAARQGGRDITFNVFISALANHDYELSARMRMGKSPLPVAELASHLTYEQSSTSQSSDEFPRHFGLQTSNELKHSIDKLMTSIRSIDPPNSAHEVLIFSEFLLHNNCKYVLRIASSGDHHKLERVLTFAQIVDSKNKCEIFPLSIMFMVFTNTAIFDACLESGYKATVVLTRKFADYIKYCESQEEHLFSKQSPFSEYNLDKIREKLGGRSAARIAKTLCHALPVCEFTKARITKLTECYESLKHSKVLDSSNSEIHRGRS